jgi:FkbM family methyltransferase
MSEYDNKFIWGILKEQIMNRIYNKYPYDNKYEGAAELFWDSICENGVMHLNKVKLPDIRWFSYNEWYGWSMIYADSIAVHHLFNDEYSEETVKMFENMGVEGPYGFEKIKVESGDVVIDAGAYIGDWSAVAAQTGGKVYAFDPGPGVQQLLNKTASLNDFKVIEAGLGDKVGRKLIDTEMPRAGCEVNDNRGVPCDVTTIDAFAEENNLHIDFIKADIEGYEYNMLQGAARVLKEDCPKLAIRMYHHGGKDSETLPPLIRKLNPNYNLILRRKTIFAYV